MRPEKSSGVKVSGVGVSEGGVSSGGISAGGSGGANRFTSMVLVNILLGKWGSVAVTVTEVSLANVTYPGSHFVRFEVAVTPVQKSQLHIVSTGGLNEKFT